RCGRRRTAMSHDSVEADAQDVRAALATLVSSEPDLPSGADDIAQRGRRRLARRRLGGANAAAVVLGTAAGVTALSLGPVGSPAPDQVALAPEVSAPVDDPAGSGGTGLAEGFPVGSAVDAVARSLPPGASIAELPMDIGWRVGGLLDVPVTLGPVSGPPGPPTPPAPVPVADRGRPATVEPG